MPVYRIEEIVPIIHGELLQSKHSQPIEHLLLDSRKIIYPATSVFFAIVGPNHNGHHYIADAYAAGVRVFVISENINSTNFPEATLIRVENTVLALQQLSAWHRTKFNYPVIAITGSNGKTIIKEWLHQLLAPDYDIVKSPRSYNSQIGVPLSVWQMEKDHNLAIFEAGISLPNEMARLQSIIQPTIGIISNIGSAHDEGFVDRHQKAQEKLKLFEQSQVIIYCKDYPEIAAHLPVSIGFSWSRRESADLQIASIEAKDRFTTISATYKSTEISIQIPFTDGASVENAIHCWCAMLYLKIESSTIQERILQLNPVGMRLEMKAGNNGCTIINDSYNSDLHSLKIALDFLQQQKQNPRKTLILSDILQSGQSEERLYNEIANLLQQQPIYRLIGIGTGISRQRQQFENVAEQLSFFTDTSTFLKEIERLHLQSETILIKGARAHRFELIVKALEQKAHNTVLEINLNALANNLQFFKSKLKPATKIMVMVKALSYGAGTYEVANLLQFSKVDYLAVAYTDEGVALRKAGITLPIMVMNADAANFDNILKYQLEPEVFSFSQLESLQMFVEQQQLSSPLPIHLKLDTGMHRLGFEAHEADQLIEKLKQSSRLKVASIFSHLSSSDETRFESFTQQQIAVFQKTSSQICTVLHIQPIRHLLNSSGIANYSEHQLDMVRLGIGLYGIDSSGKMQQHLENVSTLKSYIAQIKTVKAGESVGYGQNGKVDTLSKIATVSIGYGDGLNRMAGNGAYHVLVRGRLVPTIGNICMDMCMIDVSTLPEVEAGDEVIIFGTQLGVHQLAKTLKTIPYEILTGISSRVKRIYFQE